MSGLPTQCPSSHRHTRYLRAPAEYDIYGTTDTRARKLTSSQYDCHTLPPHWTAFPQTHLCAHLPATLTTTIRRIGMSRIKDPPYHGVLEDVQVVILIDQDDMEILAIVIPP